MSVTVMVILTLALAVLDSQMFPAVYAIDPDDASSSFLSTMNRGGGTVLGRFNGLAYDSANDRLYASSGLQDGIFEVSQQDRDAYIGQIVESYQYFHWCVLSDALGELVRRGTLPGAMKHFIEQQAESTVVSILSPERGLAIIGIEGEALEDELDKLDQQILVGFSKLYASHTADSGYAKPAQFESAYGDLMYEYDITERLDGVDFLVTIALPGEVIKTNGISDPEYPGAVLFEFKGGDFHDSDRPLYVLTVLENNNTPSDQD